MAITYVYFLKKGWEVIMKWKKYACTVLCILFTCTSLPCETAFTAYARSLETSNTCSVPDITEPDPIKADTMEPDSIEADVMESDPIEADVMEPDSIEAVITEPDSIETDAAEPDSIEAGITEPAPIGTDITEPDSIEADVTEPDSTEPKQESSRANVKTPKNHSTKLTGESSENRSKNEYSAYSANVVNSYLSENTDGTFDRIENFNVPGRYGSSIKLIVETYDSNTKKLKRTKTIQPELPIFGGFFSGGTNHYLVYGQGNGDENDAKEVLRVVKYSKKWERLGSASVYGANTTRPFDAGSLRMAEAGGNLYIHTCHTMYKSYDGLRHQANMTIVVNQSTMEVTQQLTMVANNSSGYASHSFNQFIQSDGEYIYRADHGDGAPRGTMISKCAAGGSISDVEWTYPMSFGGNWGQNYTGASIGGFELSPDTCLIAGNSIPTKENYNPSIKQRNIFVTITDKALSENKLIWLTKYTGDSTTVHTPQLVRVASDQFLLMWEETAAKTGKKVTKLVTLDGRGKLTSKVVACRLPLSDCKPVQFKDGVVHWYVTDNSKPTLYSVNPYDLEAAKAVNVEKLTINGLSKQIAAGKKVKLSVKVTPNNATNPSVKWKSSNTKVATVSQSGVVTVKKKTGGKSVKITATAQDGSGVKATYKITSKKGIVKKISISASKSVKAGKSLKLKAKVTASKGANTKLAWESSNKKYATVSSSGKVKAKKAGKGKKVKITARATDGSGKKKTVAIKIK